MNGFRGMPKQLIGAKELLSYINSKLDGPVNVFRAKTIMNEIVKQSPWLTDATHNYIEHARQRGAKSDSVSGPYQFLLDRLVSELSNTAKKYDMSVPDNVVAAATKTGEINGYLAQAPNGEFLIVLNKGIFSFVYYMSKVILSFFQIEEVDDYSELHVDQKAFERNLECNIEGHQRFLDVMIAYCILGDANKAEIWGPRRESVPFLNAIVNNAERFAVGHEMGHCQWILEKGAERFGDSVNRHMEELLADTIAMQLTYFTAIDEDVDPSLILAGPLFFLKLVEIVDKTLKPFAPPAKTESTHPEIELRQEACLGIFEQICPNYSESMLDNAIIFFQAIESVWERNRRTLMTLIERVVADINQ